MCCSLFLLFIHSPLLLACCLYTSSRSLENLVFSLVIRAQSLLYWWQCWHRGAGTRIELLLETVGHPELLVGCRLDWDRPSERVWQPEESQKSLCRAKSPAAQCTCIVELEQNSRLKHFQGLNLELRAYLCVLSFLIYYQGQRTVRSVVTIQPGEQW